MRCLTSRNTSAGCDPKKVSFYYYCSRVSVGYEYNSCPNRKVHRMDRVEPRV